MKIVCAPVPDYYWGFWPFSRFSAIRSEKECALCNQPLAYIYPFVWRSKNNINFLLKVWSLTSGQTIKEYHRSIFSTWTWTINTTREPDLFELCGLSVYLSVFKRLADKEGINGSWKDFQWEDWTLCNLALRPSKAEIWQTWFPFLAKLTPELY